MKLVFLGAEIPSNRTVLTEMGVTDVGVGFKGLSKRVHRTPEEMLANFPVDVAIHAHPGYTKGMTDAEHEVLAAQYDDFIAANSDRLASWVEYDAGPRDWVLARRAHHDYDDEFFRPVWRSEFGMSDLTALSQMYAHIVIPVDDAATVSDGMLSSLTRTYSAEFTVFGGLEDGPYEFIYTTAWTSGMRHGETIVWDGELKRFPKRMKDEVRARYRALYERVGLDGEKILEGKPKEVSKLAIWSLQQWEEHINSARLRSNMRLVVTTSDGTEDPESGEWPPEGVDSNVTPGRNLPARGVGKRDDRVPLPSVRTEVRTVASTDDDGNVTVEDTSLLRTPGKSARMCDTCFVAANCPKFAPSSECAFDFSPELRNREQMMSMLQTLAETQTERVFFSKYVEDLNGGYPDPTTGKEIDRLMGLVRDMKELENNHEFLRVSVERQTSGGILSALFGRHAQQSLE